MADWVRPTVQPASLCYMDAMANEFDVAKWLSEAEEHLPPNVMKSVKAAVSGYVASEVARMQRLLASLGGPVSNARSVPTPKRETAKEFTKLA